MKIQILGFFTLQFFSSWTTSLMDDLFVSRDCSRADSRDGLNPTNLRWRSCSSRNHRQRLTPICEHSLLFSGFAIPSASPILQQWNIYISLSFSCVDDDHQLHFKMPAGFGMEFGNPRFKNVDLHMCLTWRSWVSRLTKTISFRLRSIMDMLSFIAKPST